MKCVQCIAWDGEKCKAGVVPRRLKCNRMGCSCNAQQVKKYMADEANKTARGS